MAFRQDQKKAQKQKHYLSPQARKAIAQLEKSNLEIQDRLDLERIADAILEEVPLEPCDDGSVPDVDEAGRVNEDIDLDIYIPKDDTNRIEREIRRKALPPISNVSSELTYNLKTHLIQQLILSKMNVVQKNIGVYLIGNLNENGYLDTSIEELWQKEQKYQLETWYESLEFLQKFDPTGVGARNLQECLLIQAKSEKVKNALVEKIIKNQWDNLLNLKCDTIAKSLSVSLYAVHDAISVISGFDKKGVAVRDLQECLLIQARSDKIKNTLAKKIIKNHWDNLLNMKCDTIAKSLSVPVYDVHAAISVISGFDPRPGQRFNKKVYFNEQISAFSDSAFHIQPDFYIYKDGNNYRIEPIGSYIDAGIYDYFYEKIENGDPLTLKDIENFVKIQKGRRRFSIAVHNRHKNIVNAIKSIVRFQKEFFNTGSTTSLRRLFDKDVAQEIKLDRSTVGRIRKNKYVDTPHGIFELNFFFDKGDCDTLNGVRMASKGVKELIKNIVKSENKENPVRDKKIADILKDNYNIIIEPRTVNKYRNALGILPARLRKWPC